MINEMSAVVESALKDHQDLFSKFNELTSNANDALSKVQGLNIETTDSDYLLINVLGKTIKIQASASENTKCVRCWHHQEDVGSNNEHPELCGRCVENIAGDGEQRLFD